MEIAYSCSSLSITQKRKAKSVRVYELSVVTSYLHLQIDRCMRKQSYTVFFCILSTNLHVVSCCVVFISFWRCVPCAQTNNLFRKLTRLSRELKDKNWEIVHHTRQRVDNFRRTLPLITDLKSQALRERHWNQVKQLMKM